MSLKVPVVFVALIILYLTVPLGSYSYNDIINVPNDKNAFKSMYLSSQEFEQQVQANNTPIQPDIDFLVHPTTVVAKDGDNSVQGTMRLTSGWYRNGGGSLHRALDTTVRGYHDLGLCPAGHKDCADTVVIAPVSGKVSVVKNNKGKEAQSWAAKGKEAYIEIEAVAPFEGWTIQVMHLSSIPDYIKVGYEVKQGEYLGTQCAQGDSTASHMHFTVKSNGNKVHMSEWFKYLVVHKSVSVIDDVTSPQPSTQKLQGWSTQDLEDLRARPKYEQDIIVPDEFKP